MEENEFNSNPDFQGLILHLRLLDPEAAEWVLENAHKKASYPWGSLNSLFVWHSTPQGQDYWYNLYQILAR